VVIISVLTPQSNPFDHLSLEDVKVIVKALKPKVALLTHFGLRISRPSPGGSEELSRELKTKVIAASDGPEF